MITVLQPGLYTTIQDAGRTGYQRFGVPVAGAMDPFSAKLANVLLSNKDDAAVLEFTAMGPTLQFERDTCFSLTGADFSPKLNGRAIRSNAAGFVSAGSVLTLGNAVGGFRGYLAVRGGFAADTVMGSRSTYVKAGLGGIEGRPLRKNDTLLMEKREDIPEHLELRSLRAENMPFYRTEDTAVVRVVLGPQDDHFSQEGLAAFFSETYTVTGESDRMGYRLDGASIPRAAGKEGNIISDGVAFGSVQIPDSQMPIVMMADRQTTGGYPKLGAVITADLCRMAQLRAGDKVHFVKVTLEEAHRALREQRQFLRMLEKLYVGTMKEKKEMQISVGGNRYTVEVTQTE